MTAPFAAGLAAGCVWAAADALLLRYAAKKAAKAPERAGTLVMLGFAARWFFTIALIALALFLPQLDAVGALLPLRRCSPENRTIPGIPSWCGCV